METVPNIRRRLKNWFPERHSAFLSNHTSKHVLSRLLLLRVINYLPWVRRARVHHFKWALASPGPTRTRVLWIITEPLELPWKVRIRNTISKTSQQNWRRENCGASKATRSTRVPILTWAHWESQAYQTHLFTRVTEDHSHQLDRCPTTEHLVDTMTREWLHPKAITSCQQDKVARCHTSGEVLKALAHSNEEVLLTAAHSTCLKTSCIIKTAIPGHKLCRPWQGNPTSWLCPRRMLRTHLQQVCKVSRLSSHQIWKSCELQINQNHSGPGCLWMKV